MHDIFDAAWTEDWAKMHFIFCSLKYEAGSVSYNFFSLHVFFNTQPIISGYEASLTGILLMLQVNRRLTKQFYQDFNKENFYFSIEESEKHPTPALCIVISYYKYY